MKIAIPVKTDKENPALAPLFGKAKWFAFVEEGKIIIEKNPIQEGRAVIAWFVENNIDTIIMQEIGSGPYDAIKSHGGITIYHAGFDRITLSEALEKFNNNEFAPMDDAAMATILAHHEGKHSHADHHHSHAHHGHHH